jgi:RHS repeat-associated protein
LEVNEALGAASPVNDLNNDGIVNAVDIQVVLNAALSLGCSANIGPVISDFNPKTGPIGTVVNITGAKFVGPLQVTLSQLGGGTLNTAPLSISTTGVSFVIPAGTATGPLTVATTTGNATSAASFTVTPSTGYTLNATPASANLIQGQSVSYGVSLASTNGFNQLAQLSVSGVPSGVTSSFTPTSITAGQFSVLTLTAPANQPVTTTNLSVTAAATIDGLPVTQTSTASLAVVAPTTSLLGRTVISDSLQTPIRGVTVTTLGRDGNGNTTGCTGFSTVSDGAGNFALTNLPMACTGPQLFNFNGSTATSPPGTYTSVSLVFTLTMNQVTVSPILVHLPHIETAETFNIVQNSPTNQTYSFKTIPGLTVLVYAGTTLTLPDGTVPEPTFPLAAVQVPVDRLPDIKPPNPNMMGIFYVSFQPAGSTANLPVAVSFPNVSNTPPGTDMPLMDLDPTHGTMVPYGTGAVSADGTQVVPDPDPAHSGHLYGIVHFDWDAQMSPPPDKNTTGSGGCTCTDCCNDTGQGPLGGAPQPPGDPVDIASGLQVMADTDLSIEGGRGPIRLRRIYRTLTTADGPFGLGTQIQYGWQLNSGFPTGSPPAAVNLIAPDGNQYLFSLQSNGTYTNASMPFYQGAVLTPNPDGSSNLRFPNGTVYNFQPVFAFLSNLTSITDRNGNTTLLQIQQIGVPFSGSPVIWRVQQIIDPVGRSITITYDSTGHATSATDPLGRTVTYTYNPSGTLATVTDAAGGVWSYQYDSQNRIVSATNPLGVMTFHDTYNSNGLVSQQVQANGGAIQFAYTLANPLVATSPIVATTVTDPRGNQTTYRFNIQGFVTDVTDALGQTKSFIRDPGTNEVLQVIGPAQCGVCGPPGAGPVTFTYDNRGNILTSTDALGNTTSFTYDPVFNLVTSVTDALKNTVTYGRDSRGNLTSLTDQNGNTWTFSYDANALLVQVSDPTGSATTISYNATGDPVSATDANGDSGTVVYNNVSQTTLLTDAAGRRSSLSYDVLGRPVSLRDGRGATTLWSYDPVGSLLSVTDPRGNTTTYVYDAMERLLTETSPLGKITSYQHDLSGNLTRITDRRGLVSNYQYDALNQLVGETYADGAVVARSYDPYGRLLAVTDSQSGRFGFTYDAAGRETSQSGPTGTVTYTYDALGRVATRQVAGQSPVTYTYDAMGNMLGASMPGAGVTFSYDVRNLPVQQTRTNGVNTAYTYDSLGRLQSLIHSKGGSPLNTQAYAYDPTSRGIAISNDISQPLTSQPATASVDAANELLSNGQTTYTYDGQGNRLTETGPGGNYTYLWDARGRLASITDGSGNTTSLTYNFATDLIRVDRAGGGGAASQGFVLDSLTNVVALTDPNGVLVPMLTGTYLDSHFASVDSAGNQFFGIANRTNDTAGITNASGAVAQKLDYEPFGNTTGTPPAAYPFAFGGRVPIIGALEYFRSRFYDNSTGRFLSEDPLGLAGSSTNLYQYVGNDPATSTDKVGLQDDEGGGPEDDPFASRWVQRGLGLNPDGELWEKGLHGGVHVGAEVVFHFVAHWASLPALVIIGVPNACAGAHYDAENEIALHKGYLDAEWYAYSHVREALNDLQHQKITQAEFYQYKKKKIAWLSVEWYSLPPYLRKQLADVGPASLWSIR